MAFEKYGGQVWSDNPSYEERDWKRQGLTLGAAVGVGYGAFHGATQVRADNTRLLDDIVTYTRNVGNLSPFQIGNTFRISEFLSPYTSPIHQGMTDLGGGEYSRSFDAKFLKTAETHEYIKKLSGFDEAQMRKHGFGAIAESEKASELIFRRNAKNAVGTLHSVVGGKEKLLSSSVMLQELNNDASAFDIGTKSSSVNRSFHATQQAMDLWPTLDNYNPDQVMRIKGAPIDGAPSRPSFGPVPGPSSKISSGNDLLRRTTMLRALPAFSMERFHRLAKNVSQEILGKGTTETLERLAGGGLGVTPGPGSAMFGRFGTKAAMVLGAGVAVQQLDWVRRQAGVAGDIGVAGIFSAAAAGISHKAKFSSRTSLMVGLASFAGQVVLPGFDQGLIPGLTSTYGRGMEMRGSALNPVNYYRRSLEGFLPGVTSWQMGALAGTLALTASYTSPADAFDTINLMSDSLTRGSAPFSKLPGSGDSFSNMILDSIGHERLGFKKVFDDGQSVRGPKSVRQRFWDNMLDSKAFQKKAAPGVVKGLSAARKAAGGYINVGMRQSLLGAYRDSGISGVGLRNEMNTQWALAEQLHDTEAPRNAMGRSLVEDLERIGRKYSKTGGSWLSEGMMQGEGMLSQWKHAFFGADLAEKGVAKGIAEAGFKSPLGRLGLVFGGTLLAHQAVTGGLLGSMETSQELKDIYSGRQMIEVGKSRWWEGGGTQFEGSKTGYYRPHWIALMNNRVRERGIWGDNEDSISPMGKFFRRNFTYELEKQTYQERPYPISSAAFSDLPIIGGVLAATVGRVIKPARLMHVDEWARPQANGGGGYEYASTYEGWRREPAYNLGAPGPGIPSSPFSPVNQLSFLSYQGRELEGLTGWAKNVTSNMLLGTDTYGTGRPQLAEAGMMTSHRLRFWENAMGGGGFMNEVIRRVFPNYRKEIERHNPLMNTMPEWLPERFHYGDPYRSVEWGEARLPGSGYEALHPELSGVDPENYPLIYQYDILANVAPYSAQFSIARDRLYALRSQGGTPEAHNLFMDRIDKMVRERYNINDFSRVHDNAIQLPGSGLTQAAYGFAQKTVRKAVAPVEYMVPMGFRPFQKLMGNRGPIEQYEFDRLYGTPYAFWDKPVRDWFRPALYSAANMMGFTGKPGWRQDSDDNAAYFDRLNFEKWVRLSQQANAQGDSELAGKYEYMASTTRMGVNPQGNPLAMYWTLPEEERAFFNQFSQAQGKDRARILEMVPEDQTHLYQAVWKRMDDGDPSLFPGARGGLDQNYINEQFYGMDSGGPMPPEDWIGWSEDVDIGDIRVRYVNEMGKDLHDYGLWENQLRTSMAQPYLDGSTQYLHKSGGIGRASVASQMSSMFHNGLVGSGISVNTGSFRANSVQLEYNDNRDYDIANRFTEMMNGY